ncbi:MAG: SOS response-associated peptidase [Rhodospirillaceae bacterium]
MCGRYTLTVTPEKLREIFGFDVTPNLEPRFNIAPTQPAPVVRVRDRGGPRTLDLLRWGLVPSWSKDSGGGAKLINARGETIADKPSFRDAFAEWRCLVPADGFYEWRTEDGVKQPFRIGFRGGRPFAFAGLWESWTAPGGSPTAGETVETFSIVTTEANTKIRPIHHRMPAIVDPADYEAWLTGEAAAAKTAIRPFPPDDMAFYRVATRVNSVRNDDPDCIAPLRAAS